MSYAGLFFQLLGAGGVSFDADYQAVLDRATTLGYTKPSASQQTKQNQLVLDLKSAGIWTLLDVFYVFATDGDSDFATLNWKSPTTFQCTKVNSPTFTSNQGFTGNGTTSYLDSNFNPATGGVNYVLNSASRLSWIFTSANSFIDGIVTGSSGENRMFNGNSTHRINSSINSTPASVNLSGTGYKAINRSGATTVELYSGLGKTSQTLNSVAVFSGNQTILRSQSSFHSGTISMYSMGGNLSETQHNSVNNNFSTYISSL